MLLCNHVYQQGAQINYVARTGQHWQALCGLENTHDSVDGPCGAVAIHASHLDKIDPSFAFEHLPYIPINHQIYRNTRTPSHWHLERISWREIELRDYIYEALAKIKRITVQ